MKCQNETGCDGKLDLDPILMRVSCTQFEQAWACAKCGRIHWRSGMPVRNRQGDRSFLRDKKVVLLDDEGNQRDEHPVGM